MTDIPEIMQYNPNVWSKNMTSGPSCNIIPIPESVLVHLLLRPLEQDYPEPHQTSNQTLSGETTNTDFDPEENEDKFLHYFAY